MNICYIVVSGIFNEGYYIIKAFKSFDKAEKYVIEELNSYKNYERKDRYNWEFGCDYIEIKEVKVE